MRGDRPHVFAAVVLRDPLLTAALLSHGWLDAEWSIFLQCLPVRAAMGTVVLPCHGRLKPRRPSSRSWGLAPSPFPSSPPCLWGCAGMGRVEGNLAFHELGDRKIYTTTAPDPYDIIGFGGVFGQPPIKT